MKKVAVILILAFSINLSPFSIKKASALDWDWPTIIGGATLVFNVVKNIFCPANKQVCKPTPSGVDDCLPANCFSFRQQCDEDSDCNGGATPNDPQLEALGIDVGDFLLPGFWIVWSEDGTPYLTDGSVGVPYPN